MIKWDYNVFVSIAKKKSKEKNQNKHKINFSKYELLRQHLKYDFMWS